MELSLSSTEALELSRLLSSTPNLSPCMTMLLSRLPSNVDDPSSRDEEIQDSSAQENRNIIPSGYAPVQDHDAGTVLDYQGQSPAVGVGNQSSSESAATSDSAKHSAQMTETEYLYSAGVGAARSSKCRRTLGIIPYDPGAARQPRRQPAPNAMTAANFIHALAAHNIKEDLIRCGDLVALMPMQGLANGSGSKSSTLAQLARRCGFFDSQKGAVDFQYMVTLICLSFHCVSLSGMNNVNISALYKEHLANEVDAPSRTTLRNWYTHGVKLARLAAGGSIYILLWLAYTKLRVPFVKADSVLASDVANCLRSPGNCDPLGQLIQQSIIPTIRFLSDHVAIKLGALFSPDLLLAYGIAPETECSNLIVSEKLFQALPPKSFTAPRNWHAWADFHPNAMSSQLPPFGPLTREQHVASTMLALHFPTPQSPPLSPTLPLALHPSQSEG